MTAPARREVVREMVRRGLSERRALRVVRMSAAALRYVPRPDPDPGARRQLDLPARLVDAAHRASATGSSHSRIGIAAAAPA